MNTYWGSSDFGWHWHLKQKVGEGNVPLRLPFDTATYVMRIKRRRRTFMSIALASIDTLTPLRSPALATLPLIVDLSKRSS